MATTTNYGWETPDDTDLVKDGAAAIRTLGSSIDTTTKALNPETTLGDISYRSSTANTNTRLAIGTTGQILTVSGGVPAWTTPAAATAGMNLITRQSITNSGGTNFDSVFTSSYRAYLIVFENMETPNTASADIYFQLRYGSSTLAQNYKYQQMVFGSSYTGTEVNGGSQITLNLNTGGTNDGAAGQIMITRVGNTSERPYFWSEFVDIYSGQPLMTNGIVNESQTYTGCRVSLSTGNFTGVIAIYGLAKS